MDEFSRCAYLKSITRNHKVYKGKHKYLAFTLVELLVIISILTLTLLVAVPAYQSFIVKSHSSTVINRFVTAVNSMRTIAISRRVQISLCPSATGIKCSGDWSQGMLMFVDIKGDGIYNAASGDELVRIYGPLPRGDTMIWNRGVNSIQMAPSGYLRSQNGTFLYTPMGREKSYARALILSKTGRIRVSTPFEK